MSGTVPPLLRLPSWHEQGQLYLPFIFNYLKISSNSFVKLLLFSSSVFNLEHSIYIYMYIYIRKKISMYLQYCLPTHVIKISLVTGKGLQ
jgi:hypothetical protein